jgi:lycopene cyclase domain-containing protein
METHYLYLIIDLCCIIPTLLFSFHSKIQFHKVWKSFFLANGIVSSFFILWDILYTHLGVWWFNNTYTLGYHFFGLPLEEILFFICIPYSCVFTYYVIKTRLTVHQNRFTKQISFLLILTLGLIAIIYWQKIYTSVTFVLLAMLLIYLTINNKKYAFLNHFYLTYLFILIPFFISNGILTGAFTKHSIVNYNDIYDLGIRLYTIPLEDVFYGMLLVLLNVFLFEILSAKYKEETNKQTTKQI